MLLLVINNLLIVICLGTMNICNLYPCLLVAQIEGLRVQLHRRRLYLVFLHFIKATFTLLRFHFYPFLLMKTLPVHIAPFSNKYTMKTIGVPVSLIPFSKQSLLLIAVKKAPIATLNATVVNSPLTKECEAFSCVSIFGVHTENGSFSRRTFSNLCVSLAFLKSSAFIEEQCERKAKTEKFCSVFI